MSVNAIAAIESAARGAPRSTVEAAARLLQEAKDPAQGAFLARALNALVRLVAAMDERSLGDAAGEPSDFAVLLRVLEDPRALAALRRDDPLAAARLRGLLRKEQLLNAEGSPLSAADAARLLGISRQAVDKRRRAGRLLALAVGRHGFAYPSWQFTAQGLLPGLEKVLEALRGHDPWMQLAFFVNGNARLEGRRPLDELRGGHVEAVLRAASAYAEQGAA